MHPDPYLIATAVIALILREVQHARERADRDRDHPQEWVTHLLKELNDVNERVARLEGRSGTPAPSKASTGPASG